MIFLYRSSRFSKRLWHMTPRKPEYLFFKLLEVSVLGGVNALVIDGLIHHPHIVVNTPTFIML